MISIFFDRVRFFSITSCFIIGVIIFISSLLRLHESSAQVKQQVQSETISLVPFYWMILLIGGSILMTLSYVSWRKYKADQQKAKKRSSND